jgi:hypothetical protein
MILGKSIKYISFTVVTLITVNNIASHTQSNALKNRAIIATSPYDLLIANDIKIISAIRDSDKTTTKLASSLYNLDKDIQIIDLKKEYLKISRKYIYNKEINSHLIECNITIYLKSIKIENCNYNEKIYLFIGDIIQNNTTQKDNILTVPFAGDITKEELSKRLVTSINEKLLSHQYYEYYLKIYLSEEGITNPAKNIISALSLLEYTPQLDNITIILTKKEDRDQNNYVISKIFEYTFQNYTCETKIENRLLLINDNLKLKAPLNSPNLTIKTHCNDLLNSSIVIKK